MHNIYRRFGVAVMAASLLPAVPVRAAQEGALTSAVEEASEEAEEEAAE